MITYYPGDTICTMVIHRKKPVEVVHTRVAKKVKRPDIHIERVVVDQHSKVSPRQWWAGPFVTSPEQLGRITDPLVVTVQTLTARPWYNHIRALFNL